MNNTSRILMFSLAAFCSTGTASAQWWPGIPICAVSRGIMFINEIQKFIYHRETEEQCIHGTVHKVTYAYAFGIQGPIIVSDEDTGNQCPCPVTTSGQVVIADAYRPRQENNCQSTDPYDNSMAGNVDMNELSNMWTEGTGPSPFTQNRTREEVVPLGASLARNAPHQNTVTAGSYPFTLPFRELAAAPLLVGPTPNVTATCLSSVNPTHWQTAHIDNQVKRFNSCTGVTIATINVASLPLQVRVTPDGSQAIVTHFSSAISFIATASNAITSVLQLPASFTPSGLAISPDGKYALVTNLEPAGPGGAALGVIDIAARSMTSMIPLDTDYPQSVFINPDATLAWVVFPYNSEVEVIDLLTGVTVRRFTFVEPLSVAFNATGTVAYVAEGGGVQLIDTRTYALNAFIATGSGAADLLVTPDQAYVVVNNSVGRSVSVIDTRTLEVSTKTVAGLPRGIVAVPLQ